MKLALISSHLEFRIQEEAGTGYHLVLAQYLFDNKKYHQHYVEKVRHGDFIIVDNGAAEFGVALPFGDVIEAANMVDADEVCLPDKLKDRDATLQMHYDAYDMIPSRNRMVVPQGLSPEDFMGCLEDMMEVFDFYSIGIPKHLEGTVGGRTRILDMMARRNYHKMFNVHLLGCYEAPLKEIRAVVKKYPWVRGIDTAAPFAYAQNNQQVTYSKHLSYDWRKAVENQRLAVKNIYDLKDACVGM